MSADRLGFGNAIGVVSALNEAGITLYCFEP